MYENGTLVLTVHVEKFARPPFATIYVERRKKDETED
jgi:hypothetical protein